MDLRVAVPVLCRTLQATGVVVHLPHVGLWCFATSTKANQVLLTEFLGFENSATMESSNSQVFAQ